MEEQHAIELLKKGNLYGLEFLVQRHYLPAVRAAYLIVQDQAQAEDIVQESFIHASQKIDQLKSTAFAPWFYRIVVNAALKACQKQRRFVSLDDQPDDDRRLVDWLVDRRPLPEELAESADLHQAVWRALAQLTPRQRAVVVMKYYLDMSEIELSQNLHAPLSAVKMRLYAAREKLRSLLKGTE